MASDASFVQYVVDQVGGGAVTSRRMFGEYALYLDGKVVALICDDRLYVKPTPAGRALAPEAEAAAPYPGARPHLRVGAQIEDAAWLRTLFAATAAALPAPKPKAGRTPKRATGPAPS